MSSPCTGSRTSALASCSGSGLVQRPLRVPSGRAQLRVLAQAKEVIKALPKLGRGEDARRDARTVYDFKAWEKHRSQTRLIERLLQLTESNVMKNIGNSVVWCSIVAGLVTAYMHAYDTHSLPEGFPSLAPNNACSAFVSNTSVALSLLLVFRTNAGYGRWDEARKMWGLLINRTRDLMRQGETFFNEDDHESKAALARWTVAFTRLLRIHFQPEVTMEDQLANILKPNEIEMLQKAKHRPVKAIHALSHIILSADINPNYQIKMSENLTAFEDILGGCERLLRAPIPVSYTRHTARFLFTWLTTLPFALYPSCGPWTVPVVAGIAAVLCGIEEIGVQVEEPFGILPLDVICDRIQTDVMSTLEDGGEIWTNIPTGLAATAIAAPSSNGSAPSNGKPSHNSIAPQSPASAAMGERLLQAMPSERL